MKFSAKFVSFLKTIIKNTEFVLLKTWSKSIMAIVFELFQRAQSLTFTNIPLLAIIAEYGVLIITLCEQSSIMKKCPCRWTDSWFGNQC